MLITMLHSKIHRATVTHCELHYNGSMGIDSDYLEQVGMLNGQQIDVLNIDNGNRFTTYIIAEPKGSKRFGIYGAAAHLAKPGHKVIIIAYAQMEPAEAKKFKPNILVLDENNKITKELHKNIAE